MKRLPQETCAEVAQRKNSPAATQTRIRGGLRPHLKQQDAHRELLADLWATRRGVLPLLAIRRLGKPRLTYIKVGDADLLAPLRSLVDERPTYGYRRIGALLNRERLKNGQPRLNQKRIYRLMSQNRMLLQRCTGKPPGLAHDGKIITIRPNLSWTSDGFEIACWDGQVVREAFSLDTCDREVMAWCAGTSFISGEMIRDLMLESVERRFGAAGVPHPSQWLSDNGSCYRAHETIEFADRLGLVPCFTPVRSPQSNGMA